LDIMGHLGYGISFSSDSSRLTVVQTVPETVLSVFDVSTWRKVCEIPDGCDVALSPDAKYLAGTTWRRGGHQTFRLWEVSSGRVLSEDEDLRDSQKEQWGQYQSQYQSYKARLIPATPGLPAGIF